MIVTVAANTSVDHIVFVPSFRFNATLRARDVLVTMGGKSTNVSWILGELGVPSLALGFAAGPVGALVESILHAQNVTTDFTPVDGESRRNIQIVSEDGQGEVAITYSSLKVSAQHIAALYERYQRALDEATCVVLGGTLPHGVPPTFYTDLISLARARGLPVYFDAGEPNLSAGLRAGPTFIKPNRDELAGLAGHPIDSLEAAYRAGRAALARYGAVPVISLGAGGGLAVLPERAYYIPPLPVNVVTTAGAGDAVLTGLVYAATRGESIEFGLRLGFGAAAAVCTMPGTAQCSRADIERYSQQVQLVPFEPAAEGVHAI